MFENIDSGLEQQGDSLGGFVQPDSDIYLTTIKLAYLQKLPTGTVALNVLFTIDGSETEHNQRVFVTNKGGQNYYTKDGKKHMLPGWAIADAMSAMTEGVGMALAKQEEKQVEIYDSAAGKKLPTAVPVLINWTGKQIYMALLKELTNKFKNGVMLAETQERTNIDKVFHARSKQTYAEALQKDDAKFFNEWLAQNKGTVRNNVKEVAGTTAPGRPAPANAPSGAATAPETTAESLFD